MKVHEYLTKKISKEKLHFSLIDPDLSKNKLDEIAKRVKLLGKSDAILVGGSTNVTKKSLDDAIKTIKRNYSGPVILFPGNASGVSEYADAILFMSLLNSKDPLWISGMQALGSAAVKKFKIEALPTAYLIIEPGMKAGDVGNANPIKTANEAVSYSLAAQYFGMKYVYLEAGSGSPKPVDPKIISAVKKETNVKLIVGGGIRTPDAAKAALKAGADIIVTGTIIEKDPMKVTSIINMVKNF